MGSDMATFFNNLNDQPMKLLIFNDQCSFISVDCLLV